MAKEYEYKLSVVLIVYNTEEFLEECLDSLVNQTLDDMEIICVNDESTDNSLNILKKYAKKYDNIKIIDQKNQGGAVAGNNGLKQAKGEYVTLLDSDDIVVLDAYEKLYNKAKETDSDIVGGKPAIYFKGHLKEISLKHNIWLKERSINPNNDFDIYHDVFYWDKIYRRELIEKNDIYMIPGKLYADAPLVFKAYFYAKKITLIPDVIYFWRRRSVNESVTKSLLDIDNMKDRLVTYYYLKEYFQKAKKQNLLNDFIKIYLERFFYPIEGILMDETFKEAYLNEVYPILNDISDIYYNNLRSTYNLYIYFILNDMIDELSEFMMFYEDERELIVDNGKSYWNLKYFRNPKYNIPDEIFEIDYIFDNFLTVESFEIDDEFIHVQNIRIPETIEIEEAELIVKGFEKFTISKDVFKFKLNNDGDNIFSVKAPLNEIKNINTFNIYLKFKYNNRDELFRIKESSFPKDFDNNKLYGNDYIKPFFTKAGNLWLYDADVENLFEIDFTEDYLKLKSASAGDINYRLYVQHNLTSDRVYFDIDDVKKELKLYFKYALDENIEYKLGIEMKKHSFNLRSNHFAEFENQSVKSNVGEIKLYKNDDEILIKLE